MSSSFSLRTTGLLIFGGRLISAFTGLLFIVIVARWLTPGGFGTSEVIVTLVTFSAYPVGTVAYWATRDVARGKMVGRTAFIAGALLSGLGLVLYFAFTFVTYSAISSSILPFLLGALLVPLSYWSAVANSIVQGFRPTVYGYSLVISELAKLGTAYTTLYYYRLGIEGVILALMAAYLVQSVVSTYFVRLTASERLDFSQTRRWSRMAWLPAVSYLPTVLAVADTYVAAVGFGPSIVGYYQVAFIVASVVGYSSSLVFSLYPLLLRGGDERLPAVGVEFTLLFSVPMAMGCATLASPILFLFGGGKYLPGALGLAILSLAVLVATVSGVVDQTLLGMERVDIGERPRFWDLVRSNLLFVPMANIAYGVVYVSSLFVALSISASSGYSVSNTVAVWAFVQLVATTAFLFVKARRARRHARLNPGRSVLYYLLAGAAMSALVYLLSNFLLSQSVGTLRYGVVLMGIGLIGAALYFGILYLVDSKFKEMATVLIRRLGF